MTFCTSGGEGTNQSCVERLGAFASVGVEDPLPYKDREAWRTFQPAKA